MKNSKIKKFKSGKGIKRVTKTPGFVLKFKGKIDSKKAESAAMAFCEKLFNRCQALENKEIICAEEILYSPRKQASQILAGMSGNQAYLKTIPGTIPEASATHIRANKRNSAARSSVSAELKNQLKSICEIHETITTINSTLEQRIDKTRNLCVEKLNMYIAGLRSGNHKDFTYVPEFSDKALKDYIEKHSIGDSAIRAKAEQVYNVEEDEV